MTPASRQRLQAAIERANSPATEIFAEAGKHGNPPQIGDVFQLTETVEDTII